jgi:hypothetical protein
MQEYEYDNRYRRYKYDDTGRHWTDWTDIILKLLLPLKIFLRSIALGISLNSDDRIQNFSDGWLYTQRKTVKEGS